MMHKIIAHRGNLSGPEPVTENTQAQVERCIKQGYRVEVDVWLQGGGLFLGHDAPVNPIPAYWLSDWSSYLFVHCKNIEALLTLKGVCNCFGHDKDEFVVTTNGNLWVYPGKPLVPGAYAVLPETVSYTTEELKLCSGICTDYPLRYQELL